MFSKHRQARGRSLSVENFGTPFSSPARTGRVVSSVFSLVSTIIGGGALSIPYALAKAGIVAGPLLLLLSACVSDFSIYILVSCARRTGARNYEEVTATAFGKRARVVTVWLLFVLTYLCCIAYLVLARDLTTPVVERYTGAPRTPAFERKVCFVWAAIVLAPCMMRTVGGLRFNSVLSVTSMLFLGCVVSARAVQHLRSDGFGQGPSPAGVPSTVSSVTLTPTPAPARHISALAGLPLVPASATDFLSALPVFLIAYLCHFNVLPVHEELRAPTRARLKRVVHATMGTASGFYLFVGVLGFCFAYRSPTARGGSLAYPADACGTTQCHGVAGDILLNFSADDDLISAGRVGLSVMLLCSYPLLVLPCRNALQRLVFLTPPLLCPEWTRTNECWKKFAGEAGRPGRAGGLGGGGGMPQRHTSITEGDDEDGDDDEGAVGEAGGQAGKVTMDAPLLGSAAGSVVGYGATSATGSVQRNPLVPDLPPPPRQLRPQLSTPPVKFGGGSPKTPRLGGIELKSGAPLKLPLVPHIFFTVAIVLSALEIALKIDSITVVWSIMGSSVAMVIMYLIPAACYLKIRKAKGWTPRRVGAWVLLLVVTPLCIACTAQAVAQAVAPVPTT